MKRIAFVVLAVLSMVPGGCGPGDGQEDAPPTGGCKPVNDEIWTDPATSLSWQQTAPTEAVTWQEAVDYCECLVLGGYSDWRLPTIGELRSLIRGCAATETGGACQVSDACSTNYPCDTGECYTGCGVVCRGTSCHPVDPGCYLDANLAGACENYWSATVPADIASDVVWYIDFARAAIRPGGKRGKVPLVRCVRNG